MKQLLLICLMALAVTACGGSDSNNEQTEQAAPATTMTIDQMAALAAHDIAACNPTDTFAIQRAIMDARARRSAFAIRGDEKSARAYDEALRANLTKLNKALADTIFPAKPQE